MSDDRDSRPIPILASDAERECSIALLRDAVGEGRLTLEEFSERVGLAQAARTDQELAHLARDLPGAPGAASPLTAASASTERISRSRGRDPVGTPRNPRTHGRATKQAIVKKGPATSRTLSTSSGSARRWTCHCGFSSAALPPATETQDANAARRFLAATAY
jgi:DUF1707 SHOCT-like domain